MLLCGWVLSPCYGFIAAGLGSALADIFSGYAVYAPATFIIKGLMALVVSAFGKKVKVKTIVSAVIAEIIMALGYFLFEGFLYGFGASVLNIPANIVQGAAGLFFGVILIKIFEKNKILM